MPLLYLVNTMKIQLQTGDFDSLKESFNQMGVQLQEITNDLTTRDSQHILHHENSKRLATIWNIDSDIRRCSAFLYYLQGYLNDATSHDSPKGIFKTEFEKSILPSCVSDINSAKTAYQAYLKALNKDKATDVSVAWTFSLTNSYCHVTNKEFSDRNEKVQPPSEIFNTPYWI